MARPAADEITFLSSLNSGTILSCPECGMGLYMLTKKVQRGGRFSGSVKSLAGVPEYAGGGMPITCPLCKTGEWWYPPGTVHTLQRGWVE